jgi:hypothetical protein
MKVFFRNRSLCSPCNVAEFSSPKMGAQHPLGTSKLSVLGSCTHRLK